MQSLHMPSHFLASPCMALELERPLHCQIVANTPAGPPQELQLQQGVAATGILSIPGMLTKGHGCVVAAGSPDVPRPQVRTDKQHPSRKQACLSIPSTCYTHVCMDVYTRSSTLEGAQHC